MATETSSSTMSSSRSTSSETEIPDIEANRQIFDFPVSLPFKFGPGIYQVIGIAYADALEHNESMDKDRLVRAKIHEGDGQKWEFISVGSAYAIKCLQTGKYMGVKKLIDFADVVMSDHPCTWCVDYDERRGLATIGYPNTDFILDAYPDRRVVQIYTPSKWPKFNPNQWFSLKRIGPLSQMESIETTEQGNHRDMTTGSDYTVTTTTTVITKTTVVKNVRYVD